MNKSAINILVIEDNEGDALLIREYLSDQLHHTEITRASSFREADTILSTAGERFGIILLDLTLPDHKGETLITDVLALAGSTPVVVLTGYGDMQFSIYSLSLGVSDYLVKDELTPAGLFKSILYSIERKTASINLEQSEKRYKYLFDNNPSPMFIFSLGDLKVLDCNQAALELYEYSDADFRNKNIKSFWAYPQEFRDTLALLKNSKGVIKTDKIQTHVKSGGEVFFAEIRCHNISYSNQKAVLMLVSDVTEKMEIQERMLEHTIEVQEQERLRIASELHDGILQQLAGGVLQTEQIIDSESPQLTEKVRQKLSGLYELLNKTVIDIRDISHNLKPAEFENCTMHFLIKKLIGRLNYFSGIRFTYENHLPQETEEMFSVAVKQNLFRCLQEISNNIIKHSGAQTAKLSLDYVNGTLYISFVDDGKGIPAQRLSESNGTGIENIKRRIYRLGGDVVFTNASRGGLQVFIEVPVSENNLHAVSSVID